MIKLGKIYIESSGIDSSRLVAPIRIDNGCILKLWFEVKSLYSQYLCYERSDAFIVGIMNYAMKHQHDIYFETPISEELFYNLDKELIDVLCKTGKTYYRTKLIGSISNEKLQKANAVATGISCGVDSFFTLSNHFEDELSSYKITHLTFNNVGSHGEGDVAKKLYLDRLKRSRKFAKEYSLPLIESNSNIHDVISQNHYLTHTYTSMFAVLCLQKLYSKYFYSSSVELKDFSFKKSDIISPGHYESFLLKSFSINDLLIYSEGTNASRLDKTEKIATFPPSYNYLNVCIPKNENCGKCEKCMRTLLGLEAVDALDSYNNVFDIKAYKKNKSYNYAHLYKYKLLGKEDYLSIYPKLKKQIHIYHKGYGFYLLVKYYIAKFCMSIARILPSNTQVMLKKIYRKYRD